MGKVNGVQSKVYEFQGDLFFGTTQKFQSFFEFDTDPDYIVIQLNGTRLFDYSAIDCLNNIHSRYKAVNKTLKVMQLCPESTRMVKKARAFSAHDLFDLGDVHTDGYLKPKGKDDETNDFNTRSQDDPTSSNSEEL